MTFGDIIDSVFTFAQASEAFHYLWSAKHVGKIIIKINQCGLSGMESLVPAASRIEHLYGLANHQPYEHASRLRLRPAIGQLTRDHTTF